MAQETDRETEKQREEARMECKPLKISECWGGDFEKMSLLIPHIQQILPVLVCMVSILEEGLNNVLTITLLDHRR